MKRTPLFTLLGGVALAGVLLVLSMNAAASDPAQPAAAPVAQPSPTPSATPPPPVVEKVNATWAGEVEGGSATIAISVHEGVAIAYLCDGKKTEAWLQGTAADGRLRLTGRKGANLTGTFGGGRATGVVAAGGREWKFTASAVSKPSGLYRATADVRGAKVVGGWIVLPDGSQVGVLTTDGVPAPAPSLDAASGTVTVDGVVVTAITPEDLS